MNRACYRIVFNKRRGQLMAVAESAVGDGKGTGTAGRHGTGTVRWARLRRLGFCLLLAVGLAAVVPEAPAQVVAYKAAPGGQRRAGEEQGEAPARERTDPPAGGIPRVQCASSQS